MSQEQDHHTPFDAESSRVSAALTVGEAGERATLKRVLAQLSPADAATVGPGDDCAILSFSGQAAVTSDTMIEGPDFRLDWHTGFELGWKLAVTNLSDVAAMGARPVALTVALACPASTPVRLLEEVSRGLDAACRELAPGCGVIGGDLARAATVTGAVTALGDLEGRAPVLRSGAQPGDTIAYAGDLGLAGLGLSLLFASVGPQAAAPRALSDVRDAHTSALGAQLAPTSPIRLGPVAARAGATAMLDVSDGLALDAGRIAEASGVAVDLDADLLRSGFGEQRGEEVALDFMLYGGEDHGLLASFPADTALPEGFRAIGRVRARRTGITPTEIESEVAPVTLDGAPLAVRGWDPFTAANGSAQ